MPYKPGHDPFGGQDRLGSPLPTAAVVALRNSFRVTKRVVSARLYATALGAYKAYINGKPVGDQVLAPGWTDYRQRVFYQAYDVTSLLQDGKNAIGTYLAPGWYSTPLEWIGQGNNYGDTPNAFRAQLRIKYSDGTADWIVTDQSWKADTSPIISAEIYDGETYDARRLQPGWDTASFSDTKWHRVSSIAPQEPRILWQSFQPIRATQLIRPKTVTSPRRGIFIYDFGQNLAGVVRIRVQGPAGTDVRLRFAELLNPDGTLYVENLRNAKATDHYILAGTRDRGISAIIYLPWISVYGIIRITRESRLERCAGSGAAHRCSGYSAVEDGKLDGQPTLEQYTLGTKVKFCGSSRPTVRKGRASGMDCGFPGVLAYRSIQYGLTAFSRKYAEDLRGTQVGTAMYGIYAPGTNKANPAMGRVGVMPELSFHGPRGYRQETRPSSVKTGMLWQVI